MYGGGPLNRHWALPGKNRVYVYTGGYQVCSKYVVHLLWCKLWHIKHIKHKSNSIAIYVDVY